MQSGKEGSEEGSSSATASDDGAMSDSDVSVASADGGSRLGTPSHAAAIPVHCGMHAGGGGVSPATQAVGLACRV